MDVSPTQAQPLHPPAKRAMVFASPLTLSPCISPLSNNSPLHQSVSSNDSRSAFSPGSTSMPVFDHSRGPSCSSPAGFQSSSTTFNYPTVLNNSAVPPHPVPSSSKTFLDNNHHPSLRTNRHDHTSQVVLALSSLTPPPAHSHKHPGCSSHSLPLHSYQNNHTPSAFMPYKDTADRSVIVQSTMCDTTSNDEKFIGSVPS